MMNEPFQIISFSCSEGIPQSINCQIRIDMTAQFPTDASSAENINDYSQKNELFQQLDIGYVSNPELIDIGDFQIPGKIWIYPFSMI